MQAIQNITLETFLPLSRMRDLAGTAHASYLDAKPFPHVVFDNFFDPALLDLVLEEFPQPGQIKWQSFDNLQEVKLGVGNRNLVRTGDAVVDVSPEFQDFPAVLERRHRYRQPDSRSGVRGGGLHQIVPGGKLGVHADFNRHRDYNLDRRLNLLLYLNKNWRDEYDGFLQLWDRDMTGCAAKVAPLFNRVMVFGTTDFTYHGHPIRCSARRA